ncbi:MAG: hypothetical protein NVSMB46_05110 [Candidatus Saccharimonadales bacterium]
MDTQTSPTPSRPVTPGAVMDVQAPAPPVPPAAAPAPVPDQTVLAAPATTSPSPDQPPPASPVPITTQPENIKKPSVPSPPKKRPTHHINFAVIAAILIGMSLGGLSIALYLKKSAPSVSRLAQPANNQQQSMNNVTPNDVTITKQAIDTSTQSLNSQEFKSTDLSDQTLGL